MNKPEINQTASIGILTETIVNMAVESWRFGRVFDRLLAKLDAGEQNRYTSQFRWFIKKVEDALEQAELKMVNIVTSHGYTNTWLITKNNEND